MPKTMTLLLVLVVSCSCFHIEVGVVPWPFEICGSGPWTMKSLTLSAVPSRNINDEFIMV
jgi:hypothetical protein